jgi:hypothetical protein
MRAAADLLRAEKTGPKDEGAIRRAIATACDTMGISPQDYVAIVQSDATLSELEQHAIDEAVMGSTDPGPHAAISRESNSGKPGDLSKARSFPVPSRR